MIFKNNFYSCTHRLRVISQIFEKNSVIYVMNVLFSLPGIVLCYFYPCRDIITAELPSLIFTNIYLNYLFSAFNKKKMTGFMVSFCIY